MLFNAVQFLTYGQMKQLIGHGEILTLPQTFLAGAFTGVAVSFVETPKVEVADTVGAGDSFTAAFVASILKGLPIPDAHKIAVETSAFVCTQNGAMPALPDRLKEKVNA